MYISVLARDNRKTSPGGPEGGGAGGRASGGGGEGGCTSVF